MDLLLNDRQTSFGAQLMLPRAPSPAADTGPFAAVCQGVPLSHSGVECAAMLQSAQPP